MDCIVSISLRRRDRTIRNRNRPSLSVAMCEPKKYKSLGCHGFHYTQNAQSRRSLLLLRWFNSFNPISCIMLYYRPFSMTASDVLLRLLGQLVPYSFSPRCRYIPACVRTSFSRVCVSQQLYFTILQCLSIIRFAELPLA
jgi:hypothetical protein